MNTLAGFDYMNQEESLIRTKMCLTVALKKLVTPIIFITSGDVKIMVLLYQVIMDYVLQLHVLKQQHCKQTFHAAKQGVEGPYSNQEQIQRGKYRAG